MIVIANKTEYRLRDDLKRIIKEKPNQRCFYLELSKTDVPKEELFEAFLRTLEDIPNSYMARVYLCADKDILIILDGFMQRHFLAFVKHLSDTLGVDNFSNLVDMFEIGVDWLKIERIYTQKIEILETQHEKIEEENRIKRSHESTMVVLSELDASLVETVSKRRSDRDEIQIMIADDDQLSRTLAGNVLNERFNLVYARNGREAIQEFVKSAPDILFLDIGMPDIGGHEVLETLFQIDPHAYIIMFSGRKDKTTIVKSLSMGAQGFLGKPFTRDEIFAHVMNSPYVQNKL